jgi:hypothetical protein
MSIKLTSPYAGLKVLLTPAVEETSALGGKRVVEPSKAVQFKNHSADIPDDWMPLIEKHPGFTGERGHQRTMYLWSDLVGTGGSTGGPRVVTGAVGAPHRAPVAPHPDWDTMTPKQIRDHVSEWPQGRLEEALYWEMARRRRKGVLTGLTELLAPEPENPQPIIAEEKAAAAEARKDAIDKAKGSEPIAQEFEAAIPAGQDGV